MGLHISGLCTLIQVFDMPTSIRFYRDLLGFEVVRNSPPYATQEGEPLFHWAFLRAEGGAELMLNTAYDDGERPEKPDPVRVMGHSDAGFFIGCPDVDGAYRELQANGVQCRPPHTANYGMRQVSFSDPDGYGITLQCPVDPDTLKP